MRILLVEDDLPLANMLLKVLREESYAVDHAPDGQEAEWLAFENPYDLIILDMMLPVKDGLSVLKNIREAKILCPVLILSAKDDKDSLVEGLDSGADDYLTKPFSIEELLARMRVLLRRKRTFATSEMTVGPFRVLPARREIFFKEQLIDFTTKEYALMEYLIRNAGSVLSRTQLSEHVWDMNFEPASNVVDVYMGYLRGKTDKRFNTDYLKTVRGHGYMLDLPKNVSPEMRSDQDPVAGHAPLS